MDLINLFGRNDGFQRLYTRVCGEDNDDLNVQILAYLLRYVHACIRWNDFNPLITHRPFGYCCEYLTDEVYSKYIVPIVVRL